jgi:hypothetical protein
MLTVSSHVLTMNSRTYFASATPWIMPPDRNSVTCSSGRLRRKKQTKETSKIIHARAKCAWVDVV